MVSSPVQVNKRPQSSQVPACHIFLQLSERAWHGGPVLAGFVRPPLTLFSTHPPSAPKPTDSFSDKDIFKPADPSSTSRSGDAHKPPIPHLWVILVSGHQEAGKALDPFSFQGSLRTWEMGYSQHHSLGALTLDLCQTVCPLLTVTS